jgi:uncharacterized surface protein with fasciclin (FAS1) repeats
MKKLLLLVFLFSTANVLLAQTNTPLSANRVKKPDSVTMIPGNNIVGNISRIKEFSRFSDAIRLTNLIETFESSGPITIFVPDNAAFGKLSHGKLDSLFNPANKYDLIALVTYHAIAGKITSKNIAKQIASHKGLASFKTISGSRLNAKFDADHNIVLIDENGGQSIIIHSDIKQSNGLLHIINAVLILKNKTF